ncbi:ATPase subunit 9, putative [Leishmania donovani]|uniref:ATPase subunit 9, putative n=1 Tax=Leishmania donovani TaxID=5661 RepID=E9BI58_LEIDO|nr:ATPase subunit 9, putative [Leishmania donovani]CBZ34934.1 ATPase subunit 9, putative [Leishmania donovani]
MLMQDAFVLLFRSHALSHTYLLFPRLPSADPLPHDVRCATTCVTHHHNGNVVNCTFSSAWPFLLKYLSVPPRRSLSRSRNP